jgi:hypothetical protein
VRSHVALITSAAATAIVVIAVGVLWDAADTPEGRAFIATPEFLMWLLLLWVQAMLWVFAAFVTQRIVRRRWKQLRKAGVLSARSIAPFVGGVLLLLALAATTFTDLLGFGLPDELASSGLDRDEFPLEHDRVKLPLIVIASVLVGVFAIAGSWIVGLTLDRVALEPPVYFRAIKRFVRLRNELNTLIALAGAIVGLGALVSGALREAVLAVNDEPAFRDSGRELEFASTYVLEYGLFFSGLLAIAYAPSFLAMRRAGTRLREATYPLLAPGHPQFFDRLDERRRMDEFLQTNLSANANVRAAGAILTPLAGSLVTLLLGS